jgi:ribokinase
MITVLGSYNVDIILRVEKFPEIDETVFADSVTISHGGKGSNQAVSAQRLRVTTRLVAAIGDDIYGKSALEFWSKEGLDISHVKIKNGTTGTAYIILDKKGKNMIIVNKGANELLSENDIENALKGEVLLSQLEIKENVVKKAFNDFDGLKILNPAPAIIKDHTVLKFADILTPNEIEALQLTKARDIPSALDILLKLARKAVIITLGEKGAILAYGSKRIHFRAPRVNVIDETGAGDVFNGALAALLHEGYSIEEATKLSVIIASYSVTQFGALGPRWDEVKPFIESIRNL